MSEPLKPEEVVKFGDQVRKIWGWLKKFLKRSPAIIAVAILSYGIFGCDFVRGGIRIINSIPIPEPTEPTPFPTVIPTPTSVATGTPVYTPTPIPTIIPTVKPTATLASCATKPSSEPVSLTVCGPGRELIGVAYNGKELCSVIAGEGNNRTSFRLNYGITKQGMQVVEVNGKVLQWNPDRGFTDGDGRYFPDGVNIYTHPEGDTAPYTWGGYVVPVYCSDAVTPVPTATPKPNTGPVKPPILILFKVQGYNSPKKYNCHNPEDGPQFYTGKVCEKDSTMIFCDPDDQSKCGPCDTDHQDNWNTYCHKRDWDDPRGPMVNVTGARDWWKSDENPFQTKVHFEPGQSFMICIRPYNDVQTADGIHIPVRGTAASCVTETYH